MSRGWMKMGGAWLAAFSGYLWMSKPDANLAQTVYRLGMLGAGLALSVAALVLDHRDRRRAASCAARAHASTAAGQGE